MKLRIWDLVLRAQRLGFEISSVQSEEMEGDETEREGKTKETKNVGNIRALSFPQRRFFHGSADASLNRRHIRKFRLPNDGCNKRRGMTVAKKRFFRSEGIRIN